MGTGLNTEKILELLKEQSRQIDESLTKKEAEVINEPEPVPEPERVIIRGCCANYNYSYRGKNVFNPGCFTTVIKPGIPVWFDHHSHLVAGEVLEFEDKEDGVYCTMWLYNTPIGRDMAKLIKCGALNALSMTFRHKRIGNDYNDDVDEWIINEVSGLDEITIAVWPMGHKAMIENTINQREFTYKQLKERLFNFYKVRIETPEIEQIMQEAYNECRDSVFKGHNLIIQ